MKKITVQEIFSVEDLNLPSNKNLKNRVIEKASNINTDYDFYFVKLLYN